MEILNSIGMRGLLPMGVFDNISDGIDAAKAVEVGGLTSLEVTFRTKQAASVIDSIRQVNETLYVGAGTVVNVALAKEALQAGAQFIVCPGFHKDVVEYCLRAGVPIVPGALTPTEIAEVVSCGLNLVKVFPIERSGGIDYLTDLSGPFPLLKFIPSGGINENNLGKYLSLSCVHSVSGSWLFRKSSNPREDKEQITQRTRTALLLAADARKGIKGGWE